MRYYGVNDFRMKDRFVCNSLIFTPSPTNYSGNRRESFLFVFLCSPLGGTPFATLRDAIESHWLSSSVSLCRVKTH